MRRVLIALGLVLGLILVSSQAAEANVNLRATSPVYYLGPYYGWPAWCGLVGWRVESNSLHMNTSLVIGSTVDSGGGECGTANDIAWADMDGSLIVRTAGAITCIGIDSQLTSHNYWQASNSSCIPHLGWNTVQVVARWKLRANGASLQWVSPEFPIYIT